ncbi:hypothetical protein, partial [Mycobacterium intermedium]
APPPPPPGYGPPPGQSSSQPPGDAPGGYAAPGYSQPPPPPSYGQPPASYAQAPGGSPFSVGEAFNWAWNTFTKNALALIVPMLIYGAAMAVISIVLYMVLFAVVAGGSSVDESGGASTLFGFGFLFTWALFGFFFFLAFFYIQAAFVSGALALADGQPVSISSFLQPPRNLGSVIVAALLVSIGTSVGYALCVLPGIIFLFFSLFTIPFVVDRSLAPVDALKASFSTINRNLGSALLAYLVVVAVGIVGNAVCVGGLISIPVSLLIMTYTYRRLSGGNVVPAPVSGPPQPYQPPQQYPPQQYPPQQPYQG